MPRRAVNDCPIPGAVTSYHHVMSWRCFQVLPGRRCLLLQILCMLHCRWATSREEGTGQASPPALPHLVGGAWQRPACTAWGAVTSGFSPVSPPEVTTMNHKQHKAVTSCWRRLLPGGDGTGSQRRRKGMPPTSASVTKVKSGTVMCPRMVEHPKQIPLRLHYSYKSNAKWIFMSITPEATAL